MKKQLPNRRGSRETQAGDGRVTFRERMGQWQGVFLRAVTALITFGCIFTILWVAAMPEQLGLVEGEISDTTVYAPRDVVDTITTQANRDAAYEEAMTTNRKFSQDATIAKRVMQNLEDCFQSMEEVRALGVQERQRMEAQVSMPPFYQTATPVPEETPVAEEGAGTETEDTEDVVYTSAFLSTVLEKLQGEFTENEATIILNMSDESFETMRELVTEQFQTEMTNGISEDNLASRQNAISQRIGDSLSNEEKLVVDALAYQFLEANRFYDEAGTIQQAEEVAEAVEDVVIRKGQRIVAQGEPVTAVQIQILTDLGLLSAGESTTRMMVGLILVLVVLFGMTAMYLQVFDKEYLLDTGKLLLLCLTVVLTLGLCTLTQPINLYLSPSLLVAMWLASMTNRRLAIFMNVMMAILVGILTSDPASVISTSAFPVVLSNVLGGTAAIVMLGYGSNRVTVINAGLVSGLVVALTLGAVEMMASLNWQGIFNSAFIGMCSSLLASVVCLGTLPVWEYVFHLVTPMKLLELSNPNQPLLKQLLLEAPGTYHHSIVVGNLAESAAEAVGGNPMLARTGACYHDIGKMRRPYFFKENQIGPENPHDSISTELSVKIITSHVTDGLEMARRHRLPPQIMDIIEQHHGNTLVSYFYYKARNEAEDPDSVRPEDYRYPGHRPTSKEAAIIMMADSVEAAVRTLVKPTPKSIEEMVRKIVKGKFDDGQMDECNLTMGDFETLIHVFVNVLSAIYHERIVYPSDVPKPKIIQEERT